MSYHGRRNKPPASLAGLAKPPQGSHAELAQKTTGAPTNAATLTDEDLSALGMQLQIALNHQAHQWLNRDGAIRDEDGLAGTCVSHVGKKVIDALLGVTKRHYTNGDRLSGFEFREDAPRDVNTLRKTLTADGIRQQFQAGIANFNREADAYNDSLTKVLSPFSLALKYDDRFGTGDKAIEEMAHTAQQFIAERMRGTGVAAGR